MNNVVKVSISSTVTEKALVIQYKKNYFSYIYEILGVSQLLSSSQNEDPMQFLTKNGPCTLDFLANYKVIFLNEMNRAEDSLFYSLNEELLNKIIHAGKFAENEIITVDVIYKDHLKLTQQLKKHLKNSFVLFFKENPHNIKNEFVIQTWSPKKMIENPEYKKRVWSDLQLIMKKHYSFKSLN